MHNIISLGAGVQSSAMALMAAKGEITPMPDAAIFADTQNETKKTMEFLEWITKELPFPVHIVTAGDLAEREYKIMTHKTTGKTYRKTMLPTYVKGEGAVSEYGILPRKCTTDFKVLPLMRLERKLAGVKRGEKEVQVRIWMGISLDEVSRMKPSRQPWAEHYYPLIDKRITREGCKKWMADNGYPEPPRSACYFCPFHSNAEWIRLQKEEPEEFEKAVKFEKKIQALHATTEYQRGQVYLHPSRQPLDEVVFEDKNQLNLWNNECEGHCGV